jgi:riboflavin-specific deaminase-like protein
LQQLFPKQRDVADPLSIYDDATFPELPDRAYLFANMVSSVDGRAQVNGRAVGLGSPTDQAMMRRLRALADCVLNGARTFEADDVYAPLKPELVAMRRARGQADQPLWAVATGSGDIDLDQDMFHKPPPRPIVFVAERTPKKRRAELEQLADVVEAGEKHPEPTQMLEVLREQYGCARVLAEGGPTLNMANLRADVLDELFMTFAPKIVGGEGKNVVVGEQFPFKEWPLLEPVTIFEHERELFFRYRVRHGVREPDRHDRG